MFFALSPDVLAPHVKTIFKFLFHLILFFSIPLEYPFAVVNFIGTDRVPDHDKAGTLDEMSLRPTNDDDDDASIEGIRFSLCIRKSCRRGCISARCRSAIPTSNATSDRDRKTPSMFQNAEYQFHLLPILPTTRMEVPKERNP